MFWHNLWKANGSPRNGIVYNIKVKTRAKYHYTLRNVKAKKEAIISEKVAQSLLENQSSKFWSQVKKVKGKTSAFPSSIDGVVGSQSICELFGAKYSSLYNRVSYKEFDMESIKASVNKQIESSCFCGKCYNDHMVSVTNVISGVKNMKQGKYDDNLGHCSDHLINLINTWVCIF